MTAAEDTATWFTDLLSAAVLGTDRRPAPARPDVIGPTADDDPAVDLLQQAALAAALVRGGRTAGAATPMAAAPPETSPVAPARAVQILRMLLETPPSPREARSTLLVRWLDAASARGMRVPPTLLPTLIADSSDEVTAALRSAWGARGAWLAEPDGASGTPDATSRTSRADLEKQWSTMPARAKQEALEALGVGLSTDDEPLLERCLDERSARVRDAARLLLSELTSSRYSARMADRLRPLVTRRTPSVARRLTALVSDAPVLVDVHPPTTLDAAADRDGLPALHSDADRTKALRAIVVAAPLDTWTRLLDATPERIVAGLSSDATVIDAMARAAIRQHDAAWAAALARYSSSPGLTETMTPADRERELLQRLRSEPDRQVPQVLSRLDTPWSETIADAVLDRLAAPPVVQKGHAQGVTLPTAYAVMFPAAALPRIQYILDQPVPDADATGAHSIIGSRRALLQAATTFHAFDRSIQEAFA